MAFKILKIGILTILLSAFYSSVSAESSFKIRAREHFDTVWLTKTDTAVERKYSGIGPNINVWMEDPYVYSVGLSISIMFIQNGLEPAIPGIGEKIDLTTLGIETKYYFTPRQGGLFTRIGLSNNLLDTKGSSGYLQGLGYYLGFGWEQKFSKIGLAFEAALRRIDLPVGFRLESFSPSIGVHFYGYI